jgi:hypothetical protein
VPSGSALDVVLIDPVTTFGRSLWPGGATGPGRVFRSTGLFPPPTATSTDWIVSTASSNGYYKMMGLRVIVDSGIARVYQTGARYYFGSTTLAAQDACSVNKAWNDAADCGQMTNGIYDVRNLTAVIFTA